MQRFVISILVVFSFGACNDRKVKIIEPHPEGFYTDIYFATRDSVKNGLFQRFNPENTLIDSCTYLDGKLEGTRKTFDDEGRLMTEEHYKNGILDGDFLIYYMSGALKIQLPYVDNELQGKSMKYYESGQVQDHLVFEHGIENGPFTEYWKNGNIHWRGQYKNGELEQDTLYEYNSEGLLIRKLFCDLGRCNTIWRLQENKNR